MNKEKLVQEFASKIDKKQFAELNDFLGEDGMEDFLEEIGIDGMKEIIDTIGIPALKELVVKFGSIDDKKAEALAPSELACGLAIVQELFLELPPKIIHDERITIEKEWRSGKPLSVIIETLKKKYNI